MFEWRKVLGPFIRSQAPEPDKAPEAPTPRPAHREPVAVMPVAPEPEPGPEPEPVPRPEPEPVPRPEPEPVPRPEPEPEPVPEPRPEPKAPAEPKAAGKPIPLALRARLIALLQENPKGRVGLSGMKGDADSQAYSAELAGILAAAGWDAVQLGPMAEFPGASGLYFMIRDAGSEPVNTRFIIHAFIAAGLKPATVLNRALQDDDLLLVVGHL